MRGNTVEFSFLAFFLLLVSGISFAAPSKISPVGGCPADYSLFTIERAVVESKKDNPEHDAAWFTREVDRNADGYVCGLNRIITNPDGTKWIDNKSNVVKSSAIE